MNQLSEEHSQNMNVVVDNLDNGKINVLLIEDNPGDIRLIQELMREIGDHDFNLTYKDNLADGLRSLKKIIFNVILLDLSLPDSKGLQTLELVLKKNRDVPIIVLTGTDDHILAIEAVKSGAQDYLIKGKVNETLLERSIYYSIERQNIMKKLKESEKKFRLAFHRASFYKDILAHDMSNILQGIMSGSQLFKLYTKNSVNQEKISNIAVIINDQILRGVKLITNVRKISQLDESELFVYLIEMHDLLKNSVLNVKNAFYPRIINIQINSFREKIFLQVNEFLQDVFENLLFNAVRHNESQNIEIQINISQVSENSKNFVMIEFKDNGKGVEDSRKKKIFLRGNKEEKYVSGMGLGLSLVSKILESYNGNIWVEDRIQGDYSKGSKFILMIPKVI